MQKIITCFLICLTISACGWHLRGSVAGNNADFAPISIRIISENNHSPLLNSLRQSLHAYKMTEVSANENYSLTLGAELNDKRTAGVGSDALTSAYEMIVSVTYSISNKNGILTPPNTKASLSRSYNYNVNNANTAKQEEALILNEIRRELAQQILRRLKTLNANTQAENHAQTAR